MLMNGRDRVMAVLRGAEVDRLPVLPILHTGYATLFEVPLGRFFTNAGVMAWAMTRGLQRFRFDGVQLSMGVTAEAEALGARVEQPENGAPLLREHLLSDLARLSTLRTVDPTTGGRMPLFFSAVQQVVEEAGGHAFVLATLRGPLLCAAQLRGVEQILIDLLEDPAGVERILDFTTHVALRLGRWLLAAGAHGLVLGEATCSPNFISPKHYRHFVLPRHRQLVGALKEAGWDAVGLHICGDTTAILEDVVSTGVDFMDVDYQVPVERALALSAGRLALRGNLDPAGLLRFGDPARIRREAESLRRSVAGSRWILSSGCDIPPGVPEANLEAFAAAARG
ncbi:MAG: uroporphyrinogen decarboxylase family protein [Armatimonadota bacterium]|nr:uroporphyrinogen decarboxylase family protein [Armatimonadota bacterium]